ncbi:MAG: AEC family transporter [Thermoproteota archaeon]
MASLFETMFEIVALLSLGIFLRKLQLISEEFCKKLLSLSINLLLPIIVFRSFAAVKISSGDCLLPLIGLMLNLLLLAIALIASRSLNLNRARRGAFLLGCSTLNIGIIGLPFIELFFNAQGVTTASLLDIGNSLYVFSIAFLVASRFNPSQRKRSLKTSFKELFTQPYILSIILGLTANLYGLRLPESFRFLTSLVSFTNIVVMLISVGVFIRLPSKNIVKHILAATVIKIPIGGLAGLTLASLFGLNLKASIVTVMVALLPPAFMTIVHASTENLDLEFTTILLGFTLTVGIPLITFYGLLLSFFLK